MAKPVSYQLLIKSKHLGSISQTWQWYGETKGDLKALCNHEDYASDTRVYIDANNNVVEGYSYLVNPDTVIKATEIST